MCVWGRGRERARVCVRVDVRMRVSQMEMLIDALIDWRSRGAHSAPCTVALISTNPPFLYNISGIWCNLSPALIRFVTAHGRPALDFHSFPRSCEVPPVAVERLRPSLVAQLGGLLCFLRRLNYSTTKISRLARFYSPFFFLLVFLFLFHILRELTINARPDMTPSSNRTKVTGLYTDREISDWKCEYWKSFS